MLLFNTSYERPDILVFSPDGCTLAGDASRRGIPWLWDLGERKQRAWLHASVHGPGSLAFAPDSSSLAVCDGMGTSLICDPVTGKPRHRFKFDLFPNSSITAASLRYSRDGNLVLVALGYSNSSGVGSWVELRAWDPTTGEEGPLPETRMRIGTQPLPVIAFHPDGEMTVLVGEKTGEVWALEPGSAESRVWGRGLKEPKQILYSPDGRTLAVLLSHAEEVQLRDPGAATVRGALTGHTKAITAMAFSGDSRTIATASEDETVRLWDVRTGKERVAFQWSIGPMYAVALAPDGMRAAAAGAKGQIVVWDLEP